MLVLCLGLVLKDNFRVLGIGLETQVVGLVLVLECQILGLGLATQVLVLQQVLVIVLECNFFVGNLCLFTFLSFRNYLLKPTTSNSVAIEWFDDEAIGHA